MAYDASTTLSTGTTRPPRCKDCGKPFVRPASRAVRCAPCRVAHKNKYNKEHYYNPAPDAGSECWGCVFLEDCRYKVHKGQAPYCWAENRMNFLFVRKYLGQGDGNGSRGQIARQLATVLERRAG